MRVTFDNLHRAFQLLDRIALSYAMRASSDTPPWRPPGATGVPEVFGETFGTSRFDARKSTFLAARIAAASGVAHGIHDSLVGPPLLPWAPCGYALGMITDMLRLGSPRARSELAVYSPAVLDQLKLLAHWEDRPGRDIQEVISLARNGANRLFSILHRSEQLAAMWPEADRAANLDTMVTLVDVVERDKAACFAALDSEGKGILFIASPTMVPSSEGGGIVVARQDPRYLAGYAIQLMRALGLEPSDQLLALSRPSQTSLSAVVLPASATAPTKVDE